jgi:acyl-CoA oxidase
VRGENHGVHALVVPLRDEHGNLGAGVRIEDCGEKMGLNGVENGRIWFDHVRVGRDALLDHYGGVNDRGEYESPNEKANKRFFTMPGNLIQGRICISGASISATKTALTIAVRHGLRRTQFGPPDEPEVALLDYRTRQRRLMATASWHATETIQTCRECCGGAGYTRVNRFAALKADTDAFTTFEGENTGLMMLVARGLLTDYRDDFGELNPRELVLFGAEQAVEAIVERLFARKIAQVIADVVPGRAESSDLLEREAQLELFRWREGHITASIAQRFRRGIVCDDVRGDAAALVDAFGIPDEVPRAPIGLR